MILLDCQSTVDLFCNRKLVSRVWESAKPMTVHGNGGNLTTNLKAHVTNYGDVWFHPKAITNILSLKNVREKFRVTYESPGGESDFIVHKPNGIDIHFVMHADGLHYHDTNNRHLTMVSTVKDESEGFSARQVAQAKAAPSFQSKVGHPPVEQAKAARNLQANVGHPRTQHPMPIIQSNFIVDCSVITEDIADEFVSTKNELSRAGTLQDSAAAIPTVDCSVNTVDIVDEFVSTKNELSTTGIPNDSTATNLTVDCSVNTEDTAADFVSMKNDIFPAGIVSKMTAVDLIINCPVMTEENTTPDAEQPIPEIKERVQAKRHSLPSMMIPLMLIETTATPDGLTFDDRKGRPIGESKTPGVHDIPEPDDGLGDLDPLPVDEQFTADEDPDIDPPIVENEQQALDPALDYQDPNDNVEPEAPDPALPHPASPDPAPPDPGAPPAATTFPCSNCVRNQPKRLVPAFGGKTYQTTAATTTNTVHPDEHLDPHSLLAHSIMTQHSMKAGMMQFMIRGEDVVSVETPTIPDPFAYQTPGVLDTQEIDDGIGDFDSPTVNEFGIDEGQDIDLPIVDNEEQAQDPTPDDFVDDQDPNDQVESDLAAPLQETQTPFEVPDPGATGLRRFQRIRNQPQPLVPTSGSNTYGNTAAIKTYVVHPDAHLNPNAFVPTRLDDPDKAIIRQRGKSVELLKAAHYEFNPYDPSVVNKTVQGAQSNIVWRADDLKASHREDDSGAMPISLGKILENPGMTIPIYFITDRISNNELSVEYSPLTSTVGDFVYSVPGEVKITMIPCVKEIIEQFEQYDISKFNANTPAAEHLFKVDDAATSLTQRQATIFHNFVAKCLFMTKRVRTDISTAVAFLTTRVKGPDQDDWKRLVP